MRLIITNSITFFYAPMKRNLPTVTPKELNVIQSLSAQLSPSKESLRNIMQFAAAYRIEKKSQIAYCLN